jgi:hypothetical protein
VPNTQYYQWRAQWNLESNCPATSFVTVDRDVARNPPLVILQSVQAHSAKAELLSARCFATFVSKRNVPERRAKPNCFVFSYN